MIAYPSTASQMCGGIIYASFAHVCIHHGVCNHVLQYLNDNTTLHVGQAIHMHMLDVVSL
jgi:hypothetical protein